MTPIEIRSVLDHGLRSLAVLLAALPAGAQVLYSETFDADPSAGWVVNAGPGDNAADFFFDYGTVGIPPAPRSSGTTRGMKLEANIASGVFGGISVSPAGQTFTGSYVVVFDIWMNFNGPLSGGGSGSTHLTGGGVGTASTNAQWAGAGAAIDSVFFAMTGDGASAADFRAYSSAATTSYPDGTNVYYAVSGSRNASDSHYVSLGGNTAPVAQLVLFPGQTGVTQAGAPGMRWHTARILVHDGHALFSVNDLDIARVDLATVTLGGGNILFLQSDVNATSSTDPNKRSLLFGLIDNIVVRRVGPPEIAALRQDSPTTRTIAGSGLPRTPYAVQGSSDLAGTNWVEVGSSTADVYGDLGAAVPVAGAGFMVYRLAEVP